MFEDTGNLLSFTGADGTDVNYRSWTSEISAQGKKIACVYLHGASTHSEWISDVAPQLSSLGIDVYGLDRRGSGVNRGLTYGTDELTTDLVGLVKHLRPGYDEVHLFGLCHGGITLIYCSLLEPDLANSLILVNPLFKLKQVEPANAINYILFRFFPKKMLPIWPEAAEFTANPRYHDYIMNDPIRLESVPLQFWSDLFRMVRYINKNRSRLRELPLFVLLGQDNNLIKIEKVYRFLAKTPTIGVTTSYRKGKHALYLDAPDRFVRDASSWILDGWKQV